MPMWKPEKDFDGQDVYIIGGGPSLKGFNWRKLIGKNTIGCNSAFRKGSGICNICFFSDIKFIDAFHDELCEYAGRVVTHHPKLRETKIDWLHVVERTKRGLGIDKVTYGGNSGCGAINLALMMGAKRVLLLGFDCKPGKDNEPNWHKWQLDAMAPDLHAKFLKGFKQLAEALPLVFPDREIINLNPDSAIPFFPFNTFTKAA